MRSLVATLPKVLSKLGDLGVKKNQKPMRSSLDGFLYNTLSISGEMHGKVPSRI